MNTADKPANEASALQHQNIEHAVMQFISKFLFNRRGSELTDREKKTVWECFGSIHGPICMFAYRLPRTKDGKPLKLVAGKTARSIERLARTVKSGGRTWRNAWNALPHAAWYMLVSAHRGQPMPMYADVPPPAEIAPIIPSALQLARQNSKKMLFRDHATIAIMQAYWYATQHHPELASLSPKIARPFIEGIGKIYSKYGLLPGRGLGVISSVKTLDRLIKEATGR